MMWVNLKTLKLSEIIQTQKVHILWLNLYEILEKGKKG